MRAARHDLPLMLAIIGGDRRALRALRRPLPPRARRSSATPPQPIGVHSPGHVAATDDQAREELWPHYQAMMSRIGGERGWPPVTRAHFEREAGPDGALYVGSPETVAAKIAATVRTLGLVALRPEVQRRRAAARRLPDEHRAVRHPVGPAGARAAGRGLSRDRAYAARTGSVVPFAASPCFRSITPCRADRFSSSLARRVTAAVAALVLTTSQAQRRAARRRHRRRRHRRRRHRAQGAGGRRVGDCGNARPAGALHQERRHRRPRPLRRARSAAGELRRVGARLRPRRQRQGHREAWAAPRHHRQVGARAKPPPRTTTRRSTGTRCSRFPPPISSAARAAFPRG